MMRFTCSMFSILTHHAQNGPVFHEDGRNLDPGHVAKGIENFSGQAHEAVFDQSGRRPDFEFRELIDGHVLPCRPPSRFFLPESGDSLLDEILGDGLDERVHPLKVDEELPDPPTATATRAGGTLALDTDIAVLHFRRCFHRS